MDTVLHKVILTAIEAGEIIMKYYRKDYFIQYKADQSPLTLADLDSAQYIKNALSAFGLPFLCEEDAEISYNERRNWKNFWCVDPLDGTKEFISENGEFTVNIALIDGQKPVLGVVYVPVSRELYFGEEGEGAYKTIVPENFHLLKHAIYRITRMQNVSGNKEAVRVVASRSHRDEQTARYIDGLSKRVTQVEIVSRGSALKFCMLAEGKAEIYPRFGPCMEWDTAAGHAILNAAGGAVYDITGIAEILYNKPSLLSQQFIAVQSEMYKKLI